ncbi:MAG: hypothetical protein WCE21_05610 [Candidatus Babeliales bacterium]
MAHFFIISAPSGAGKTTIVERTIAQLQPNYAIKRVVTYTTRAPRAKEVHGVDYYFVSKEIFDGMIAAQLFMEWASVYGHYYGTPVTALQEVEQGVSGIAILDVQGAQAIRARYPHVYAIALLPPDAAELENRLRVRATEPESQMQTRLAAVKQESVLLSDPQLFTHRITPGTLETMTEQLVSLIAQLLV